ncbi:hypothetical protein ColKHC_03644 [Colletotrichum higginsianum]|nr:hypothetical protein ColKHC_03644 [Colletotrichum higginsianum]
MHTRNVVLTLLAVAGTSQALPSDGRRIFLSQCGDLSSKTWQSSTVVYYVQSAPAAWEVAATANLPGGVVKYEGNSFNVTFDPAIQNLEWFDFAINASASPSPPDDRRGTVGTGKVGASTLSGPVNWICFPGNYYQLFSLNDVPCYNEYSCEYRKLKAPLLCTVTPA